MSHRFQSGWSRGRLTIVGLALVLLLLTGCGRKTYPVEGKIVVKDGALPVKDLAGYIVELESEEEPVVGANGVVEKDGTFRVGTFKEGDGAVLGKHRVVLSPPVETEGVPRPKKLLLDRYKKADTSGLEVTIEAKKNEVILEVEAQKRAGKDP